VIDYAKGRRLKLWGHAAVIDDDQALRARVCDPDYPAPIERIVPMTRSSNTRDNVARLNERSVSTCERACLDFALRDP
jgi:hypothetical protein